MDGLDNLSKEELIDLVQQYRSGSPRIEINGRIVGSHVQLEEPPLKKLRLSTTTKKVITATVHSSISVNNKTPKVKCKKKKKIRRPFDFSQYRQRHIALKVWYNGEDYLGLASQSDTDNTVESKLFDALQKTCLIENRLSSVYSRCGRTDKGVSASGQVIALNLRSKLKRGVAFVPRVLTEAASKSAAEGIKYMEYKSKQIDLIDDSDSVVVKVETEMFGGFRKTCLHLPKNATVADLETKIDHYMGIAPIDTIIQILDEKNSTWRDVGASESCVFEKQFKSKTLSVRLIPSSSLESKLNMHKKEHDYAMLLNNVLPLEIRVLGWSEAPRQKHTFRLKELNEKNESQTLQPFDARFSCRSRTYRYFFPKRSLNLHQMQEAASYFVGQHDFRNFCKMDVVNVHNFVREILTCKIFKATQNGVNILEEEEMKSNDETIQENNTDEVFVFEICGRGFLWHQVRCMVAVLFLVGRGQENPSIYFKMPL